MLHVFIDIKVTTYSIKHNTFHFLCHVNFELLSNAQLFPQIGLVLSKLF